MYRLSLTDHATGAKSNSTAEFPTLKWAWKAALDIAKVENWRTGAKITRCGLGYKIGKFVVQIIEW